MARKSNTRAAQGSGSIRQRSDGTWEARFVTGHDLGTGKAIRKSVYGKTQKEARQKLAQAIAAVDNKAYREPCKMTLGEWLDTWADTYLQGVKPRTVKIYMDDIRLHIKPYLAAVKLGELDTHILLDVSQQEQYDTLLGVGIYTFRTSWGSPFPGIDWSQHISDRWGWRIHPITGNKQDHQGLDIALPEGTPIHAVHDGKVDLSTSEELGNCVTLKDGRNRSIYAHMHSFAVEDGQRVKAGDIIGYVGSSGNSTGAHLHIVCEVNGENICPLLMLSCEVITEE